MFIVVIRKLKEGTDTISQGKKEGWNIYIVCVESLRIAKVPHSVTRCATTVRSRVSCW